MVMRVKYYDYEKYIGWYSDEVINHFKEGVTFKSEDYETVGDFVEFVKSKLEPLGSYVDSSFPGDGTIILKTDTKNIRYVLDEQSKAPLCSLLDNYSKNDELPLMVRLIIGGRGEVFHDEGKDLGVTFIFHSDERNHQGRPHVHVKDRNTFAEISIDLKTVKKIKHSKTKENLKFSEKKFKRVSMTKQEVESYIAVHGNARQVIDTLKAMNAEGVNLATLTEAQLTERLNGNLIAELDYASRARPETRVNGQPVLVQPQPIERTTQVVRNESMSVNSNAPHSTNISSNVVATVSVNKHINKHVYVWVLCFLFGWFGVDRFYRGRKGLLKLLTFGGFGVWWFADWIIAVVKAYGNAYADEPDVCFDKQGKYVHRNISGMDTNWTPLIILGAFLFLGILGNLI